MTSGARQGLDLVSRAVLSPRDVVVVESSTFTGLLSSLHIPDEAARELAETLAAFLGADETRW